jgi:hypothetical protein
MVESAASRDIGHVRGRRGPKQLLSGLVEAKLADELDRRSAEKSTEMLLQRARCHAASGGEAGKGPRAVGLRLQAVKRSV